MIPNILLVVVAVALAVLFAIPPDTLYVQLLITEIASYALLAIAFDVCMGFTGLLSLATALYFGLGQSRIASVELVDLHARGQNGNIAVVRARCASLGEPILARMVLQQDLEPLPPGVAIG